MLGGRGDGSGRCRPRLRRGGESGDFDGIKRLQESPRTTRERLSGQGPIRRGSSETEQGTAAVSGGGGGLPPGHEPPRDPLSAGGNGRRVRGRRGCRGR